MVRNGRKTQRNKRKTLNLGRLWDIPWTEQCVTHGSRIVRVIKYAYQMR
jgi:hypothetical protein